MLVVALLETVHTMAHGQQQQRGPWLVLDAQVAVAAGMIPHHSCCVSCGVDCAWQGPVGTSASTAQPNWCTRPSAGQAHVHACASICCHMLLCKFVIAVG
jgi:hypothetical protein